MRIFYKAIAFADGKDVTAFFIKPDLERSKTYTFTNWGEGIYYLDILFTWPGEYCGKFFENGCPTVIRSFSYACKGVVHYGGDATKI